MAFTFNWAGVNINPIQGGSMNYQQTIRNDAANYGNAARGAEQYIANRKYAQILDKQHRMAEIQGRIKQLEARNDEIRKQMLGMAQTAVAPTQYQPSPAFVSTAEHPTPTNYPYSNELR